MNFILDPSERQEAKDIVSSLNLATLTPEQKIYINGVLDGVSLSDNVKQDKAS